MREKYQSIAIVAITIELEDAVLGSSGGLNASTGNLNDGKTVGL